MNFMQMPRRRVVAAYVFAISNIAASSVFSAADPNAPPPDPNGTVTTQDPNAPPQGTVAVGMQPQAQPQPQPAQPPDDEPPPRRSLLIGAAPTFHIPVLGAFA